MGRRLDPQNDVIVRRINGIPVFFNLRDNTFSTDWGTGGEVTTSEDYRKLVQIILKNTTKSVKVLIKRHTADKFRPATIAAVENLTDIYKNTRLRLNDQDYIDVMNDTVLYEWDEELFRQQEELEETYVREKAEAEARYKAGLKRLSESLTSSGKKITPGQLRERLRALPKGELVEEPPTPEDRFAFQSKILTTSDMEGMMPEERRETEERLAQLGKQKGGEG
jgi:hypothetical protein